MRKILYVLGELADADIDWLVQTGVRKSFRKGSVLIEEGRPIPVLFILLDGQLSVTLKALGGKEIAALKSGEILGELSFLDSRPPSGSVIATNDVTVLAISRTLLSAKLESDAPFAARFYRALGMFLAARLRKTQQRLGYDGKLNLDDTVRHEDEMDAELLGGVALAGARFEWMMRQLRGAPRVEAS